MIEASSAGRHRLPARLLHWLVALVLPIQFLLGWLSEGVPGQQAGFFLLRLHYQLGMLLVLLMVLRLAWRLARGTPGVQAGASAWRRRLVVCVHGALYALMFLLPISGYVIWVWMQAPMDVFGWFDVPRLFVAPANDESGRALAWYVHVWGGWLLIGLAGMHIGAALCHQSVRRDGLIVTNARVNGEDA